MCLVIMQYKRRYKNNMRYGKFREVKKEELYNIKTPATYEEWKFYYGHRINYISEKINELGLYNETVEILYEWPSGRYMIRFPSNGLRCEISTREIKEIKYHPPEHLFEI